MSKTKVPCWKNTKSYLFYDVLYLSGVVAVERLALVPLVPEDQVD